MEFDRYLEQVSQKIAETGWAVQFVGARQDRGVVVETQFAYSIGLSDHQHAEIIVVGRFPPDVMASLINAAIRNMKASGDVYTNGCMSDRVLKMPVMFRDVTDECAMRMAVVAKRLYGSVRLVQMFVPDKNGHFPWHADCEEGFNEQATLQYVSPAPGLH